MLSNRNHKKTAEKHAKLMDLINAIKSDCAFYKKYHVSQLKLLTHVDHLPEKAAKARSAKLNVYYYGVVCSMESDIELVIARIEANSKRLVAKFDKYVEKGFISTPINPAAPDYQLAIDCVEAIHLFDDVQKAIKHLTQLVESNARTATMKSLGLSPKPLERLSSPTEAQSTSTSSISRSLTLSIHHGSDADSPVVRSPTSVLSGARSDAGTPVITKPLFLQQSPLGTPTAVIKPTAIEDVSDEDRSEVYVL